VAALLAVAGCYDFDALGGHDAGIDLGPGCMSPYDCNDGFNCFAQKLQPRRHRPAPRRSRPFPAAGDGVYWNRPGRPRHHERARLLLNMKLAVPGTLCSAEAVLHSGKTRDGFQPAHHVHEPVHHASATSCRLWAVQSFKTTRSAAARRQDARHLPESSASPPTTALGNGCPFGSKSTN